jgi:hypothetical protein
VVSVPSEIRRPVSSIIGLVWEPSKRSLGSFFSSCHPLFITIGLHIFGFRYGGSKLERARDLFEQCLEKVPADEAADFYIRVSTAISPLPAFPIFWFFFPISLPSVDDRQEMTQIHAVTPTALFQSCIAYPTLSFPSGLSTQSWRKNMASPDTRWLYTIGGPRQCPRTSVTISFCSTSRRYL